MQYFGRMSDEERDIDIESDEEDGFQASRGELQFASQAVKRAHHNALERKRRDHIKDSFCSLRDSVPSLQGEKSSRAQILKKASEYIEFMRRKNSAHQQDIDDLKKQNNLLESQIYTLEKAKFTGNFAAMTGNAKHLNGKGDSLLSFDGSGSDTSDSEHANNVRRKKLKT
ncbi:protein max-like isoform X2 [Oratosquilla oratoria]|uniref:protein max-like isoform X2 n=1 Tax=Oratosquilla oratoria TaxID=337810 RepID=UPI003F765A71